MGKPTGFMEFPRRDHDYAPVEERIRHWDEFIVPLDEEGIRTQGARCMDCGIPFCHPGCPVNNIIPDWNDLVFRGDWKQALTILHSTNNFPEFTGRVCPAPCEEACTLNISDAPVTIKSIECAIVDRGWKEGWIEPQIAPRRTRKRVAVIGSGPAGLACAQQLARAGHHVDVYEKNERIGGLLRYGIPDFKLSRHLINRRMAQMQSEGVEFRPNSHVGVNVPVGPLIEQHDALVLACGCEHPRDLDVPGRELEGVHFAMDFLTQQNNRVAQKRLPDQDNILATGLDVVVIGGGDTGSDCVGTSIRQGAKSVTQLEIMPKPPTKENKGLSWPNWPSKLRTSSSHQEGCRREWAVSTQRIRGAGSRVDHLDLVRVEWLKGENGKHAMQAIAGSQFSLEADLVLLAMGFTNPVHEGLLERLSVDLDARGNVKAPTEGAKAFHTSVPNVFACGDVRRGQSLVVWAIREGRRAARAVDFHLMGSSDLPG